jgi:hypothetical protein
MDRAGRFRRLVLSLIVGVAAGSAVYGVAYAAADPERQATTGGFKFVFYVTALVGAVAFLVTLKLANWRADKKYSEQLHPQARTVPGRRSGE